MFFLLKSTNKAGWKVDSGWRSGCVAFSEPWQFPQGSVVVPRPFSATVRVGRADRITARARPRPTPLHPPSPSVVPPWPIEPHTNPKFPPSCRLPSSLLRALPEEAWQERRRLVSAVREGPPPERGRAALGGRRPMTTAVGLPAPIAVADSRCASQPVVVCRVLAFT